MPTYDYRCKACGHAFELYQTMSEGVKRKCPSCGKSALERLIGAGAGLLFKGSGYYLTDYRSKSYEDAAKAEAKSSSGAEPAAKDAAPDAAKPAAGAKPEAKPDAKSGAKPAGKGSAPAAPRRGKPSPKPDA